MLLHRTFDTTLQSTAEAEASLQAVRDSSELNVTEMAPVLQTAGVTSNLEARRLNFLPVDAFVDRLEVSWLGIESFD